MELIISKLHENKVILHNNIPSLLSDITCDIYCTKCIFRECINCRDKAVQYNLSQATKTVTYRQWMYENSTYEKNGINNFTWNYSEPGHGKGAADGVGGTLKRSADQVVAEGKDVTDLNVLINVLSSKCPSIMLIEVKSLNKKIHRSFENNGAEFKESYNFHIMIILAAGYYFDYNFVEHAEEREKEWQEITTN
ncbi:hypothetical protein JTB14_017829 [Gonioctena quinquepunctata]|nr:hypothetical protein JTB14_017829 [Gonioctena quinquepunctata]